MITGNSNIMKAAVPQLVPVAYGKTFGCTIYGKYTQTTGPNVSPKLAINNTNPKIIKGNPNPSPSYFCQNPKAVTEQANAAPIQPYWNSVFLPILLSKYEANNDARTCSKFMKIGRDSFSYGMSSATICPP